MSSENGRRLRRTLIRGSILIVWVLLVGWLLRFEAFPAFFTGELKGYNGLLDDDILVNDTWMRVLYDGAPIGYVHRNVDTDDADPQRHIHINNQLHLRVRLLGRPQDIRVESSAFLDLVRKLQSFEADIRSPLMNLSLQAIRRTESVTRLAQQHQVSRKFVYQQQGKAASAIDHKTFELGKKDFPFPVSVSLITNPDAEKVYLTFGFGFWNQ